MEAKKMKDIRWIDLSNPTAEDLEAVKKEFDIHPIILEELKGPSAREHVEAYKHYLFFIYYFPVYDPEDETSVRTEIDFIITKDAVITVHYAPLEEAFSGFVANHHAANSLLLTYRLIEHLMKFQERQLRHIREKVERIGKEIFKNKEREVLEQITYLKRDISEYRIVARLQEPLLRSLLVKGEQFWDQDSSVYLNDLLGDHLKIVNRLEDYRDAVSDFEDTNNQLMNLKINSVMKTFTSLSFLTFPFMLFAELFSMNTVDTPLAEWRFGFWIIVGLIALGMISFAIYFRRKGWF